MMLRVKGYKFIHLLFLGAALWLLIGNACLKPPALPQWDIILKIPVYRKTVRLGEIVAKNEKVRIQPDSSFVISLLHHLGPVDIADAMSLIPSGERKEFTLEDFIFPQLGRGKDAITAIDLFGLVPDSGLRLQVEPFRAVFEKRCELEDIQVADILDGVVVAKVENKTPLTFDAVEIKLLGGVANIESLGVGEVRISKIRFSGTRILNQIDLRVALSSSGSGPDSITIFPWDSLVVNIALESLKIGGGIIRVAHAQTERILDLSVVAKNPLRIDSLVLERGRCVFTLGNRLPTAISLNYDCRKVGVNSSQTIEPGAGTVVEFDLAGVGIDNLRKTGGMIELRVRAEFDSRGEFVEVTKDCRLEVGYVIVDATPRLLVGMFHEPVYIFSRLETIPNLIPFNAHGVRFSNAELVVEGENSVGFPSDVFVTLRAIRNNEVVGSIDDVISVEPGKSGQPTFFTWTKPVMSLLNSGPDLIICQYSIRVKDYGCFRRGQSISGDVLFNAPLRLAFAPDTVFLPETQIVLNDREREAVQNYLVDGNAIVQLNSALPLGLKGKLILRPRSNAGPQIRVDSVTIPFSVPAGIVNAQGKCISSRDTVMSLSLDSNEVTIFRSHDLSAGLILEFDQTDTVVVYTNDQVNLDAMVELRIRIDNKLR
ncbi:MAG: hypothetical protein ACUVUD_03035 [bacterium]